MNVGKLKRVAIKEFTKSPAKTGILLALVPVALYFCVPLFFGASKSPSLPTTAAAKQADFVLPVAANTVPSQSRLQPGWIEVAKWLDKDVLAMPKAILVNGRDPFAVIVSEDETERIDEAVEDDERIELAELKQQQQDSVAPSTPENPIRELGLQLSATMVGRHSRLATINGKTYQEGDSIPVIVEAGSGLAADSATNLQLDLTDVERRFVVLKMDSYQHRLRLRNEFPEDAIVVKPRLR